MHSRIFQISEEPISKEDFAVESDLYDILPSLMDYVDDNTNREADIEWLMEIKKYEGCFKVEGDKLIIEGKAFKHWCEDRIEEIKRIANEKISADDFCRSVFRIIDAVEDRFGFYVYIDGNLMTMDYWLTHIPYDLGGDWDKSLTFYIGATIDYHC